MRIHASMSAADMRRTGAACTAGVALTTYARAHAAARARRAAMAGADPAGCRSAVAAVRARPEDAGFVPFERPPFAGSDARRARVT